MREIKFRAWDIKSKEMYLDTRFCMQAIADERYAGYGEDLELMQYTGLKDKNGKEIYEGDLFKRDGRKAIDVVIDIRNFACKYEKYEGRLLIEIIGNIYENPELIK